MLWLCHSLGAFTAIELAFDHVQEFALPTTAEEYRHTTENVHMRPCRSGMLFSRNYIYSIVVSIKNGPAMGGRCSKHSIPRAEVSAISAAGHAFHTCAPVSLTYCTCLLGIHPC